MNKKIVWLPAILALAAIAVLSVRQANLRPQSANRPNQLLVAASFYPLYFFASQIGGAKAMVANLTPNGAEPHDYEPTSQDMVLLANSRLLILNGGGFEAWAKNIEKNINPKTELVVASQGLIDQTTDPHTWLSPLLAQKIADRITQGFIKADPNNTGYYQTNAQILKNELADLDTVFRQGLSHCQKKEIITSHAAFGYLAQAYGLRQMPITGLSPEAEPSPKQLAEITKFARDNGVKYIFYENLASPKLAQTVAREIGAKILALNPLESLSPTELAQGKTYLTEMQNNLTNLRTALLCE
ncbi:MAG: zinc ABC transporter substrate-binding protein [Patescibacteria group bacterium]|nr:zinc ABC transporter substrate-binding protein [Patescibacteria group bacterium]